MTKKEKKKVRSNACINPHLPNKCSLQGHFFPKLRYRPLFEATRTHPVLHSQSLTPRWYCYLSSPQRFEQLSFFFSSLKGFSVLFFFALKPGKPPCNKSPSPLVSLWRFVYFGPAYYLPHRPPITFFGGDFLVKGCEYICETTKNKTKKNPTSAYVHLGKVCVGFCIKTEHVIFRKAAGKIVAYHGFGKSVSLGAGRSVCYNNTLS